MKRESGFTRSAGESEGIWTARPLSLKVYPDAILRELCAPVQRFDGWLLDVADEMFALMRRHDGIGLAAPQAGINQRFFVAEIDGRRLCLVNPTIMSRAGRENMNEGCLSLPSLFLDIKRNARIEVSSYGLLGKKRQDVFQGWWARVIQHEIDHLNGVMICDYADLRTEKTGGS
ncbi:MAG: peptide deformylase [Syntrophaceae bacterium]